MGKVKKALVGGASGLLLTGLAFPGIASGAPFVESQFEWNKSVSTINNGESLAVDVKVNSNDSQGASGKQNLSLVLQTDNSGWKGIPSACDKDSTLSQDHKTLTCNVADVAFGTALQFQSELIASGTQGDVITPTLTVNGGETKTLAPVTINTVKGVALQSNYNADVYKVVRSDGSKGTFAVPFTVSVPKGGEKLSGPITFDVKVKDVGTGVPASTNLVPATDLGKYTYTGEPAPCGYIYPGTWSPDLPGTNLGALDSQKFKCSMEPNGVGKWTVTITDYNSDLFGKYDKNGIGGSLSRDDLPIITGSILFTNSKPMFQNSSIFTAKVATSNLRATTSSGEVLVDTASGAEKESSIVVVGEGTWSGGFYRYLGGNILDGQGAQWSTEGKIAPGTAGWFGVNDERLVGLTNTNYQSAGDCILWDKTAQLSRGISGRTGSSPVDAFWSKTGSYETSDIEYLYQDTAISDLSKVSCGTLTGWSKTAPTEQNNAQVRGIRYTWNASDKPTTAFNLAAWLTPSPDAKAGDRIWAAAQRMTDGTWINSFDGPTLAALSGYNYPGTNYGLDTVTVTGGRTYARKAMQQTSEVISAGDTVSWSVTGGFVTIAPNTKGALTFEDKVPEGLKVVPESISDGGVWDEATRTITWTKSDAVSNTDYTFTYKTVVQTTFDQTNKLVVKTVSEGVDPDPRFSTATATAVVSPYAMGETVLVKSVDKDEFIVNGSNSWELSFTNKDVPQDVWDIIDILPYNGDVNGSQFVGGVDYGDLTVSDPSAVVYWTDADPKGISPDPSDASNGSLGTPSGMWSTTKPASPTAFRVVGTKLASGGTVNISSPFKVKNSSDTNKYTNIAYAKATTTQLQMIRSSATALLAEGSQLQIKKKQLSVEDYGPEGTVTYLIQVKNNGEGTAHDVVVTDLLGSNLVSASYSELQQGTSEGEVWNVGDIPAGETVTAKVVAKMAKDAKFDSKTVNTIIVSNPSNPKTDESCSPNDTVEEDTDQCDVVGTKLDPAIDLVKKADRHDNLRTGDVVTYTFTVKNTGQLPLHDVKVSEKTFTGVGDMSEVTCPETVLAVDASMECHATYTIQKGDVDKAAPIDNTADVVGISPLGQKVTDEDVERVTPAPAPAPSVPVIISGDPLKSPAVLGILAILLAAAGVGVFLIRMPKASDTPARALQEDVVEEPSEESEEGFENKE